VRVRTDDWNDWQISRNHPAQTKISNFQEAISDFESSTANIPSGAAIIETTQLTTAR
jgi:hypothetical protein